MHFRIRLFIIAILLNSVFWAQEVHDHDHSIQHAFVENKGQWNEDILFKTTMDGGNLWVQRQKLLYHLTDYSAYANAHGNLTNSSDTNAIYFKQTVVHLNFLGANKVSSVEKYKEVPSYYNFFKGNDRSTWVGDVRAFDEVVLKDVYDGIHLRLIENHQETKYQFEVAPNVDPKQIVLGYDNYKSIRVNRKGELTIKTSLGDIVEGKPYAYQIINGKINEVDVKYVLEENRVTYQLGDYNTRYTLIIDPTLVFATYNGAVSDNFGMTATYGYDGSAYVAGTVFGNDYPTPDSDAFDVTSNFTIPNVGVVTTDAFISKYDPTGTTMLWSTFYGGGDDNQGTDVPHSLICDTLNNIYVYGVTSALDFPIVNGFQQNHAGGTTLQFNSIGTNFGNVGTDIYVAKFSANGHNLLGSTYIGGSHNDGVNYKVTSGNYGGLAAYDSLTMNYGDQLRGEIMLDDEFNILVASSSRSADFPTVNPFQPTIGGQQDGVVFKLSNDCSSLIWSSFFGGGENDGCYSIKVNSQQEILFAGGTSSTDISMPTGGYQLNNAGGKADGFVVKLSPDGANVLSGTFIGTSDYDQVYFVDLDNEDYVYVLGQTLGEGFPIEGNVYENQDASQFITVFESDLSAIYLSTVFGSPTAGIDISPAAFMVDICGNVYVSGWGRNLLQSATSLSGMPITPDAFQTEPANGFDFYLMVLERGVTDLLYATYMGGDQSREHVDGGTSRFDRNGVVYQGVCAGCGGNSDFPTTPGAWSNQNLASNCNALVLKFDFNLIPSAQFSVAETNGCVPFEVTFENFSSASDAFYWDFGDGQIDSVTFEPTITYDTPGTYEIQLMVMDSVCMITDTALTVINVYPTIEIESLTDTVLCQPDFVTYTVESNGTVDEFRWSLTTDFSTPLNDVINDPTATFLVEEEGYVYVQLTNDGCEVIDSVYVSFAADPLKIIGDSLICLGQSVTYYADYAIDSDGFISFDWYPEELIVSGSGTNEVEVLMESSGYLYLSAIAANGCEVVDSIFITVGEMDWNSVSASVSDSIVPTGTVVQVSAAPDGYSYQWFPSQAVLNPTDQVSDATVQEDTWFVVIVSDGVCSVSDSVLVKTFEFTCDEPFIFVPNAFTPNGDGSNDVLYARSTIVDFTRSFVFRVFNRWGEMVFETDDVTRGWDGTWRGRTLAPDVYDYYVEGYCIDGQSFFMKGNVTLIR